MNELTEKQEIKVVIMQAKEHNWQVFNEDRRNFGRVLTLLNLTTDGIKDIRNFHIVTDKGIILKRRDCGQFSISRVKRWELRLKDNSLIIGSYMDIVTKFVEEYNK